MKNNLENTHKSTCLLNVILEKINKLETDIENINLKLNKLEKLKNIEKNTKRMEEHIEFVENTYDKVKSPFHFLMNKVSSISSISSFPFSNKIENNNNDNK